MEISTYASLALYFIVMLGIGLYAYKASSSDIQSYMLGGRQLGPKVTALSAGASDMSGWMLMGVPGAMYVSGLSSAWIAIGLTIGAYLNYVFVAPRLRTYTESLGDAITLPDYFENRFEDTTKTLRLIASVIIIVFFTLYTSSGIVAGGKLFESSFGVPYQLGSIITAGVVVAYTMVGGFLAVSMTDFVQGCIMFLALIIVPTTVFTLLESETLAAAPDMFNMFVDATANTSLSGMVILSLMAWGLGYFGQPHIIVRFMAIKDVELMPQARRIGMSWMILSLAGAIATGLYGFLYVRQTSLELDDPETIFIVLSQLLFHPFISGFLLAAILAAIMSTISSQLLVTSSSLTKDIFQSYLKRDASENTLVNVGRTTVALVAIVALMLAQSPDSTILDLVANAWAGFGAAFGPVVLFSLYWRKMTLPGALCGMIVGAVTVLLWIYAPVDVSGRSLSETMYEIVPGFILSSMTIVAVSKFTQEPECSKTLF